MSDIRAWIDNEVKTNDVVLFMKGTPTFPQCGFSSQVVQILDYLGLDYKGVNVLENADIRQGIKEYSNWPTIPSSTSRVSLSAAAISSAKCSRKASWPRS